MYTRSGDRVVEDTEMERRGASNTQRRDVNKVIDDEQDNSERTP